MGKYSQRGVKNVGYKMNVQCDPNFIKYVYIYYEEKNQGVTQQAVSSGYAHVLRLWVILIFSLDSDVFNFHLS